MKVAIITYVYGDTYQDYIPLILYSIGKSYPEYYSYIFLYGTLRTDVSEYVDLIRSQYNKFKIIEHTFDDCPNMSPLKAKTLRWVLWDDSFKEYDYMYYIDSDILYVREPIPLHEQHIRHMNYIGSDCVSNIVRETKLKNSIIQIARTFKYSNNPFTVIEYLFKKISYRFTGIHFVKTDVYFRYISQKIIIKYKNMIYSGAAYAKTVYANDEAVLYEMMKESGINTSVFAIQTTSTSMFGANLPEKKEFCPHHGVHLGIFRWDLQNIPDWAEEQLKSEDYRFYVNRFKELYMVDPLFIKLYNMFNDNIKVYIERMCKYYDIPLIN